MRSQGFEITPDILVLIAEIDEFKGAWPHLSARASTRLTSMRQIATLDSVGALMRLAGHQVSDDVVEAALFGRHTRVDQSGSASPYVDCATLLDGVYDGFAHIPLGLSYITQLWSDMRRITSDALGVMVPADGQDDQQGGEMPTDPHKTPPEAGKLLEWWSAGVGGANPASSGRYGDFCPSVRYAAPLSRSNGSCLVHFDHGFIAKGGVWAHPLYITGSYC